MIRMRSKDSKVCLIIDTSVESCCKIVVKWNTERQIPDNEGQMFGMWYLIMDYAPCTFLFAQCLVVQVVHRVHTVHQDLLQALHHPLPLPLRNILILRISRLHPQDMPRKLFTSTQTEKCMNILQLCILELSSLMQMGRYPSRGCAERGWGHRHLQRTSLRHKSTWTPCITWDSRYENPLWTRQTPRCSGRQRDGCEQQGLIAPDW